MKKILGWLLTGRRPLWTAAVIVVLLILVILSVVIGPIADYATAQPQNATVVAALVALLGILITQIVNTTLARTGQRNQQQLEALRAQATSFQSYLERMGELLLNHQLRSSVLSDETDECREVGWGGTPLMGRRIGNASPTEGENSRAVAQAQTLAVLEGLDPARKRLLVQFLYYSALIDKDKPVIMLFAANLERADLRWANLSGADLRGANLGAPLGTNASFYDVSLTNVRAFYRLWSNIYWANPGANLRNANLSYANLSAAELRGAKLTGAYLGGVNLSGADLRHLIVVEADLSEANLGDTNLTDANLARANLSGANLSGANLSGANLSGANLAANLWGADLSGANLRQADLELAVRLTQAQIDSAIGDATTKLPGRVRRPASWTK